jgi:hypothetical protein
MATPDEHGWVDAKSELPPIDTIVIVRYPSGYDGAHMFAWGARVDDGEHWFWGIQTGYSSGIRIDKDTSWNDIECDDDYGVTHWMPLPKPPVGA